MSKSLKLIFFAAGGLVGLLLLFAVATFLFVDVNAYKPRLEAAASEALGMEVRVGGRMEVGVFPGLSVILEDVHIRNRGADLVNAKEARLGIDLLPLLHKEVRFGKIVLKHPSVSIERDRDGEFNFEKPTAGKKTLPALNLATVSLSDMTLRYTDKQSGKRFEAADCKLEVRRLLLLGGGSPDLMKNLSFTAELGCAEIQTKDFAASGLKISVTERGGIFDVKPVTMELFGGQGSGDIQADCSGPVPQYHVRYSLSQFHIEEFFKILSPQKIADGQMNFSVNLSMQGSTVDGIKQTANGDISIRGGNLTLNGTDLDREFARFESSQNFNLVDVGAFFFAGPVGLAVTKGYNFASIFQGTGGRSEIRTLVSDWKVDHGKAHAQDVAMATSKNRIALTGSLDFVNQQFDDVTMALIDAKGCTMVRQKIHGTFQKPVVEKPNILKTLTGPALTLLKKGVSLFPGGECEVFYAGSVAPPK